MLSLTASNLGHRFAGPWLYRGLNVSIAAGNCLAVLGPNGSGKSTLLRIAAGQLAPAEGELLLSDRGDKLIAPDARYRHISWAGPSIEQYPPLTVDETLRLHFGLRTCTLAGGIAQVLDVLELTPHRHKPLRHMSSGLQQRLQLGLALFSESALLLLDEPTSHMDEARASWALHLLDQHMGGRTFILASNLPREFERVANRLQLA